MLVVAVGLAFPDGKDAAAQSSQGGYTYTQRICQEWGQHPRPYYVRDPIPGSDWRNDGGWAIILDRGAGLSRTTTTFIPGDNPTRSVSLWNSAGYSAGARIVDNSAGTRSKETITRLTAPSWVQLANYEQGAWDGYDAVIVLGTYLALVALDANGDGAIDATNDAVYGPSNDSYYVLWYTTTEEIIGGSSYIRWADLAWCR